MATCALVPSAAGSSTCLTCPSGTRVLGRLSMSITLIMALMIIDGHAHKEGLPVFVHLSDLSQFECDGDCHHDRHGLAVEQRRREPPLPHRLDRRLVQQSLRPQHADVAHGSILSDHRFENDDPFDTRGSRERRIDRRHVGNLPRRLDVSANVHDGRGWWRRRRRRGRVNEAAAVAVAEADDAAIDWWCVAYRLDVGFWVYA